MRFGGLASSAVADAIPAVDGEYFTFRARLRGQVARSAHIELTYIDSSGATLTTDSSTTIVTSTSAWTEYVVWGRAPQVGGTVVGCRPMIEVAGNAVGQFTYVDAAIVTREQYGFDVWDGDTATDTYYDYVWDGTAGASKSRRLRLDDRDPLLLNLDPGETDWDFMQPLVQAAGLRLFCDELRRWYLVDPDTYTVAGLLELDDPQRGEDRISRDRGDWADAVIVKYSWIGEEGTPLVRYDSATAGGTMLLLVEWERPYPGPGAAAAILARYQGRGRVQEIKASAELDAAPAMALTTALPSTPPQEGVVSRVRYDLDAASIAMTITPRDLVDA